MRQIGHVLHLTGDAGRGLRHGGVVRSRHHERSVALAVVLQDPGAHVGKLLQFGGDGLLKLPLGHAALGLVGQVDDERGLAHLLASARDRQNASADDEHVRHLAMARDDLRNVAAGLVHIRKPRAGRQFGGNQDAVGVLAGHEAEGQKRCARHGDGQNAHADGDRGETVMHRPVEQRVYRRISQPSPWCNSPWFRMK